ncbi:MAG TPA: porin [Xanthobacteraceae bacterium]|jgi:hypothetical protein|nr:porin [Xanthobacteraceae bacterium]
MDRWLAFPSAGKILRTAAIVTAVVMPAAVVASSVAAQTLADPTPTTKSSGRGATAPAPAPERATACATYGAGFVQMPGSDACIKLGGYVTMQSGVGSSH